MALLWPSVDAEQLRGRLRGQRAGGVTCDATVSTGTAIQTEVSSGLSTTKTVCIAAGSYGTVNLTNYSRTAYVTLRPESGTVSMSPQISNTDFVKFDGLTLDGPLVTNCSTNIQFLNGSFEDLPGPFIDAFDKACTNRPFNILIDNNDFTDSRQSGAEGAISARDDAGGQADSGITISNNYFEYSGQAFADCGDAIQLTGGVSGVVIGPGNKFVNWSAEFQAGCDEPATEPHSDCIQFFGSGQNNQIIGNWFKNCDFIIIHTAAPDDTTFRNNVIDNMLSFQIDQSDGFIFDHNTIWDSDILLCTGPGASTPGAPGSITATNVIVAGSGGMAGRSDCIPNGSGGAITFSYFSCQDSGDCGNGATNTETCTPTFVGGADPDTFDAFSDWQLTGTCGVDNGNDSNDRGTNYYGS
jgi:hypothetical protein